MIPHLQSTPFTTAASSLLTILHHLNPNVPLSKEKEFHIWHSTANLPTRASSIYALALYAKQHELAPKVVVEKKEYDFPDYRFYRYTKEDIEHAAFSAQKHLEKAENKGIQIEERQITLDEIKRKLQNDNILLLRLNVKPIRNLKRNTSNYVVVHGYGKSEGLFHVVDPAFGALSIPEEIMQEAFESLQTKKYRDHRMIVFHKDFKTK